MAAGGLALKFLQWFIRAIEFCCTAIVLAIFSYFLATLHNHDLGIATWIRAVEGISGAGVLYTAVGLLLLCCLAGHALTSFIAIVLDIAFAGAFVYVAWENRHGASSCKGVVETPFGTGDSGSQVVDDGHGGFTELPKFHTACRLTTACFAVSIVAIIFFLLSAFVELALVRNRRKEARFGPSPANNYTSGSARRRRGLFGFRRKRNTGLSAGANELPEHTHPDAIRQSYATDTTRVGDGHLDDGYNKYAAAGTANGFHKPLHHGAHGHGHEEAGLTHPTAGTTAPAGYRYSDGTYNAI